jgi:RNA polymerase sigma-54 factor
MERILAYQRDFFESGDSRTLRPLILRDIADQLGVNESTISRATANKYVASEHGTFPLKYFFNTSIPRDGAEGLASESVREYIRELISSENPKNPLSDQQLTKLLEQKGIKLARRTVAKYREMMDILSSSQRKKSF